MKKQNLIKWLRAYLATLIPASIVLFSLTATLKLSGPVAVRFGLIDKAVAHEVPPPLLLAAAVVEFACVFLLSRGWLSTSRKLQLLFLLGTTFLTFRLSAFNQLFVPHCGCWGPITMFTERIGQGLEGLLVVFLICIFLGYPLHLLLERLEVVSAGQNAVGPRSGTAATSMGGAILGRHP